MKFVFLIFVLCCAAACLARDLMVGTADGTPAWRTKADYTALPFMKRVKEVYYSNPQQLPLRGIIAKDLEASEAVASITAGGLGFPFVKLKLKSVRGSGLNYQIEMYT